MHDPWVCTLITMWVCLSVRPSNQLYLSTGMCNSHFWLTRFAEHHNGRLWSVSENAHTSWTAWYIWLLIHFLKLAGKITKKRKYIKKKYWSCQDLNHFAPGCWITRKPPRPSHMKYTLEQFIYISFILHEPWLTRQIKKHDPWVCNILHDPCVCTIVTMWVLQDPWSAL